MKRLRLYVTYFLLMFLMTGMLAGCQKKTNSQSSHEGDAFALYYLNTDESGLVKVERDFDLSKDPKEAAEQVIKELSGSDDADELEYQAVVNDQVKINSIQVDENANAVIDFGSGYREMKKGYEVLLRAAIVKTITQIDGIENVSFTIDGETLTNTEGVPVGIMKADSFVLDKDKSEVYSYTETVDLYLANEKGDELVEVSEDITVEDNQSMEEAVLEALKISHGKGTQTPLPENLKINHISVIQNICYVDLSEEIKDVVENVNDEIKIFSMVNSLTSLDRITQVQFTIDGKICKDMNEVPGFDAPLAFDYSYVSDK